MINTKICPKCQGSNIMKIKGNVGAYGSGNNIPVGWSKFRCFGKQVSAVIAVIPKNGLIRTIYPN